ncbi:MAG: AraC family transcriptional regulator [Spirosomataceae bacterium]
MRVQFEHISASLDRSFNFRTFCLPAFDGAYHYHPEYELTLIVHSSGKRFVGNDIAEFQAGDLVLIGPNLPHCWKNDDSVPNHQAESVVIQFREDFLGADFFQKPEMADIARLLQKSAAGIVFSGAVQSRIGREMQMLGKMPPFQQLLSLLDILDTLAHADEYRLLNETVWLGALSQSDSERINKVYAYLVENFRQDIDLNHAAEAIYMTPTAFCRYFKRMTKKTFFDVVTEYRVRYASQLLVNHPDKSVTEVCFESGFGNVSHFNKQFKTVTNFTPLHYRKAFEQ